MAGFLAVVSMQANGAPNSNFNCDADRGTCECDPAKANDCDMMKANCLNGGIDKCSTKNGKTTCMCVVAERTMPKGAATVHPAARTH
jgi:hypothetical protein